jgi:hypothetical protein
VPSMTARRVWPSYGLPGSALACSTNCDNVQNLSHFQD